MKLYNFRSMVWAGFFVTIYLSFFAYGIIWLNNGYRVDDMLTDSEIRTSKHLYENTHRLDDRIDKLESSIMESAFKGVQRK